MATAKMKDVFFIVKGRKIRSDQPISWGISDRRRTDRRKGSRRDVRVIQCAK